MKLFRHRALLISGFLLLCFMFVFGCATVTYERGHPRVYKVDYIQRVAVLPFGNEEFTDELIERLVNNSKWRVIDQETLKKIMKDQDVLYTEGFDKDTAVRLGKTAGVDLVVFGEYRGSSAVIKGVDVSTAEYLAYENIDLSDYNGIAFRAARAITVLIPYRIKFIDAHPNSILYGSEADKAVDE